MRISLLLLKMAKASTTVSRASIMIAATIITILMIFSTNGATEIVLATTNSNQTQNSEPVRVAAGGGNGTAPWTIYTPQSIDIKAGQSVTWDNPTTVGEPHTVTFVRDNNTMAGVVSPFGVSNATEFMTLPPRSNNEPILIPGTDGTNTLIAVNARTFNPVVIDSNGSANFMNPNANYTMTGTEKYVNSGWFLPQGFEQEFPGAGNTFTVTFEKPGIYPYVCILHPWMVGSVNVQ
jgi:plastocyanin